VRDQTAKAKRIPLTVVVSIAVVFMTMIVASIVVTVTMTMTMIVVMPAALVIRLVFSGPYEEHRPIAGIILSAMLAPIPRMAGRYV
jgi:uncharacterized protein (DUF983 family)